MPSIAIPQVPIEAYEPFVMRNPLDDGLDFHITPDGRGRSTTREVIVNEFVPDPETGRPSDHVRLNAGHFNLPWIENADVPEDEGIAWDDASASVLITQPGTYTVTVYGPAEFKSQNPGS